MLYQMWNTCVRKVENLRDWVPLHKCTKYPITPQNVTILFGASPDRITKANGQLLSGLTSDGQGNPTSICFRSRCVVTNIAQIEI